MKKLLCALCLLLMLTLCFPAVAETADDAAIINMLEDAFSEIGLDYFNVILNEDRGMVVVDMAIDGLTANLLALKNQGFDETHEAWAEARTNYMTMHGIILDMFEDFGRSDLRLILNMVNDDAYIREDYSTIRYNPLLSIGVLGTVAFDVMAE